MAVNVSDLNRLVYSGDARADALMDAPPIWNFWPDGRNVLCYTFDASPGSVVDNRTTQTVTAFNEAQKLAARQILQHASAVTGIVFAEVPGSAQADIHFAATNLQGTAVAGMATSYDSYSFQSNGVLTKLEAECLVYLDNVEHANINNQPVAGTVGYEVLLHEVGHMLGLAHPFDSARPLPLAQDNTDNSVMSYTWQGAYKTQFQLYDVLALDWIYGRDGLGGTWGYNSSNGLSLTPVTQPVWFVGSQLADLFASTSANETFDGASGIDTVTFHGVRAGYSVTRSGNEWQVADGVSGRDGTDLLLQVERLRFSDRGLALDLDGAAGTAARLMGVTFGVDSLAHHDWVGVVLAVVDSGMPAQQLATLALQAILGPLASNAQVVARVYSNLFHTTPDAATQQAFTALLDSGAYTRASLVLLAAASDVNATNIDLVGLSAHGLDFVYS